MFRMIGFLFWALVLLALYGAASAYGYSPFGDGHEPRSPGFSRSGPVHK